MKSVGCILVAVKDPWAKSFPALAKALQLARGLGAELRLFHGIADPVYLDTIGLHGQSVAKLEHTRREECLTQLQSVADSLRRHRVPISCAVEWDYPVCDAILRHASRCGAGLIVAECHATKHRMPWLLRFTDWELVRRSSVPVLLVKHAGAYRRPRILLALDPTHAYAKPAKLDREILRYGSAVSDALHGALHVVHAYDPMPLGLAPAELAAPSVLAGIEQDAVARAEAALARELDPRRIPAARRHIVGRHPVDAIEQVAEDIGSAIVVMGAISRSGLKRVFLGNTAEKLLDQLPCDVLVVKPRNFTSHLPRGRRGIQVVTLSAAQAPF